MADQNKQQPGRINPVWFCLGIGVGLCFGAALDNMGLGVALGMSFGLCCGMVQAQKNGKQGEKREEEQE